ncbi:uncharacterized protein LOC123227865 [Mangifera indica]|uniref:uncharacterized protein LOC123227865 n=1 Tax=Mangifera indica TaxID=29780 RepID=UPI001CFB9A2B|nr:uncharacterized protein LOC123227865 [Mangifera indica]
MGDVLPITFMSDRQKGIIHALQTQWPNAKSRFCARHVYANFRKTFPGVHLRNLFWAISRTSNKVDFHEALNKMKAVDEIAYKWVIDNEPDQWSRFGFDTEAKSDHMINNMSETFNSWLGEYRELSILSLLELYRRRIMKRLHSRLKAGTEWVTPLPPLVVKKLNKSIEIARNVSISYAGLQEFELSGIPCQHAICSILHMNFPSIDKFVDDRLQISAYMRTYAEIIHPIPDKRTWPEDCEDKLQPPVRHGKAGRPKKARRKNPTEERKRKPVSTLRCSHCHELGHNKSVDMGSFWVDSVDMGSFWVDSVDMRSILTQLFGFMNQNGLLLHAFQYTAICIFRFPIRPVLSNVLHNSLHFITFIIKGSSKRKSVIQTQMMHCFQAIEVAG